MIQIQKICVPMPRRSHEKFKGGVPSDLGGNAGTNAGGPGGNTGRTNLNPGAPGAGPNPGVPGPGPNPGGPLDI